MAIAMLMFMSRQQELYRHDYGDVDVHCVTPLGTLYRHGDGDADVHVTPGGNLYAWRWRR